MSKRLEDRILEIAALMEAGQDSEAKTLLDQLKKEYPRANDPVTDVALAMMIKHMRPRW